MADPFDFAQGRTLISLEGVHKSFRQPEGDSVSVLKGINFSLQEGEMAAIIGPSGSGKSTLLQIIGLMQKPDEGVARLFGKDTAKLSEAERDHLRRDAMNFIFQFDSLLEELNVRENLELVLEIKGLKGSSFMDSIDAQAASLGIAEKLKSYPRDLSSGEKTRANIARALLGHPRLLLADEPTGNLDPKNAKQVADEFVSLVREASGSRRGMGIILVTHNPELARLADSVYRLQDGGLKKE